jgi:hypothetical protein
MMRGSGAGFGAALGRLRGLQGPGADVLRLLAAQQIPPRDEQIGQRAGHKPPLTPEQVAGIARLLNTNWVDPWAGGVGSFISHTGSYAALAASVFAASALALTGKVGWPPLVLLPAFGWELQASHASPNGPIAFGRLILSTLWIWWSGRSGLVAGGALRWPRRSAGER